MQDYSLRARSADGFPGRGYRFVADSWVVYPFGHGLSYDRFSYEWTEHGDGDVCKVGLRIKLDSEATTRPSSTSVLLFLRPPADKAAGLQKKLVDFQKVEFAPSESSEDRWSEVHFELRPSDFELLDEAGAASTAAGTWTLQVGEAQELLREISVLSSGLECGVPSAGSASSNFLAKRVVLP